MASGESLAVRRRGLEGPGITPARAIRSQPRCATLSLGLEASRRIDVVDEAVELKKERAPFLWLLLAQLFFIFSTPFAADRGSGQIFLYGGVFGIAIAGVYAARARRSFFFASLALLVPTAGAWLGPDVLPGHVDDFLRLLSAALCYTLSAVVVARAIAAHRRVTSDTLLGAINVYLLIAFAFMMLHALMIVASPGAYTLGGTSLHERLIETPDSYGFATLIYFSLTTMTTLGYGDIVPVDPMARLLTSAEAVVGQLFVAIIIARIVSLEVSQRMRGS